MVRRFVCLLLIALMLASQTLCFAHMHHGGDVAEPADHAARPHFHLGGHSHPHAAHPHTHEADDSHENEFASTAAPDDRAFTFPVLTPPVADHDHDAVYLAGTTPFLKANPSAAPATDDEAGTPVLDVPGSTHGSLVRRGQLSGQPLSFVDGACPIFLRTLSLRL